MSSEDPVTIYILVMTTADAADCGYGTCVRPSNTSIIPSGSNVPIAGATFTNDNSNNPSPCDAPVIMETCDVNGAECPGGTEDSNTEVTISSPSAAACTSNLQCFSVEDVDYQETVPFDFLMSVPTTVDASDGNEVVYFHWRSADACTYSEASPVTPVCIIPDTDTPAFEGWDNSSGDPTALWSATMDGDATYLNRSVRESTTSFVYDGCWAAVDTTPAMDIDEAAVIALGCTGPISMAGQVIWQSGLDGSNKTSDFDGNSRTDVCIDAYRTIGVVPCDYSFFQIMQVTCVTPFATVWPPYDVDTKQYRTTLTQVGSKHIGESSWHIQNW